MKPFNQWLAYFALSALVSPTILPGEANHFDLGSHLMSQEASLSVQGEKNQGACIAGESGKEAVCGYIFDRYPAVYFPTSTHWLSAVSALGDSLEIEDGSVWKVNSYDSYKALNWRSNDPLIITQNNRWFSSFNYRIVNRNTGASIEANLFLGPVKNGEYTRYIIAIDSNYKEIKLSDNTNWEISYLDTSIFRDWTLGDAIIIGLNSGWDAPSEGLLINVNMNNCARAKQF